MIISGPLTLKNYGETDAVRIPMAYAKITEGPVFFATGYFISKVGIFTDETFSNRIFEFDIVTDSPGEESALVQALSEWCPEMVF